MRDLEALFLYLFIFISYPFLGRYERMDMKAKLSLVLLALLCYDCQENVTGQNS